MLIAASSMAKHITNQQETSYEKSFSMSKGRLKAKPGNFIKNFPDQKALGMKLNI